MNHTIESFIPLIGDNQPPKNNNIKIDDNQSILLYSAKKNIANVIDEYSTLYPATISASASGKSNGALLVSAKIDIKNITDTGSNGIIYHVYKFCLYTISIILNEFDIAATGSINNAIETSYDISCAADLSPPNNAYFELLVHPAPIIEYTPNDDTAYTINKL